MKAKGEDKATCCCCDPAIIRMQEIRDEIKIIGTRSTWLLGLLVVIVLALAGFALKDFGTEQVAFILAMKTTATILLLIYSGAIVTYTPKLIAPNFGKPMHGTTEPSDVILDKLNGHFNSLISAFTLPLFCAPYVFLASFLAIPYLRTLFAWVTSLGYL